jgi:lipopolysaccharide biosynthesis glycosyltransferase
MSAAAKSLLNHTRMDRVWFLIEDDEFTEQLPDVIRTKNMSGQKWFSPDGPNYNSRVTYMDMIRLALPEIFPEEERILWLDIDTIVVKDIGELLETDLEGNYAAMVEEPMRSRYPFQYFNAGVVLMDLERMRDGIYRKMIDLVNRKEYTAQSQDMLNIFCQGEILPLDAKWNHCPGIIQESMTPYIRHFAGGTRSQGTLWFEEYSGAEWKVKE